MEEIKEFVEDLCDKNYKMGASKGALLVGVKAFEHMRENDVFYITYDELSAIVKMVAEGKVELND